MWTSWSAPVRRLRLRGDGHQQEQGLQQGAVTGLLLQVLVCDPKDEVFQTAAEAVHVPGRQAVEVGMKTLLACAGLGPAELWRPRHRLSKVWALVDESHRVAVNRIFLRNSGSVLPGGRPLTTW